MVQAICDGWISASGVSIYLLHHAVRDQRVGAGRADHNHDLGGGSIEDLGLVQGDRWGRPRHRRSWPVRVVDQGGSAQDHDQGGGSGGPGHGTPQAFNSAVDLPRARLWAKAAVDRAWARRGPGRLSSRRRPGRWLRRGPGPGLGRSVGLAAASVGLASSRRGPGRHSDRRPGGPAARRRSQPRPGRGLRRSHRTSGPKCL